MLAFEVHSPQCIDSQCIHVRRQCTTTTATTAAAAVAVSEKDDVIIFAMTSYLNKKNPPHSTCISISSNKHEWLKIAAKYFDGIHHVRMAFIQFV